MPLSVEDQAKVLQYCDAHLPDNVAIASMFDYLDDQKLLDQITSEYYAARYIYKLGEALAVAGDRMHGHVKFQIVQYAGIYEAIIVYLLWSRYASHPAVTAIQFHHAYKVSVSLPSSVSLTTTSNEELFLCVQARHKTPTVSIKFDDKVDAAVKIGFLDIGVGEDIKRFYKLRNAIHLESAVKNDVKYELADSQLAYRRLQPFNVGIREFLISGVLPKEARLQISALNHTQAQQTQQGA